MLFVKGKFEHRN